MSFPGQQLYLYNGGNFKFSSVVDGTVLDLSGGKAKEGSKICTWDWNGGDNQKWRAASEGNGFRLEPNVSAKNKMVVDLAGNGTVCLWTFNGNRNQQWIAEPVPGADGAVIISNLENGECLRNIGHGSQVKCSPKAYEDRSIWWYMTAV